MPFINFRALTAALIFALSLSAFAVGHDVAAQDQPPQLPKPTGHINDLGEALEAPTKQRLETVLENLKQKIGVQFVIVTIKTAGTDDLYDYSLRLANQWDVGAPASREKSLLVLIAADTGKFFTQVSRSARVSLPEGVVGDMGLHIRQKIESGGLNAALVEGVRTFVNVVGEGHNFDFVALEPQGGETLIAQQQRPRTVQTPAPEASANPEPTPTAPTESNPTIVTPTPEVTPSAMPTETPSVEASQGPTPAQQPTETPVVKPTETPAASPEPGQTPSPAAIATVTPGETPAVEASPTATAKPTERVASNSRPPRTATNKPSASPASPDDELEQVELVLTLPADQRVDKLKAFIAAHPTSAAISRAKELIVVAYAMVGDQRMQRGDISGGLEQFRLAIAEAPADMNDRLFSDVIARIPLNLFFRGQRDAANEAARQVAAMAQGNAKRLLALTQFYLTIENGSEAARLADAALQIAPDSAAAHQALGAARHIDLHLDDAEKEYTRALSLDPKSSAARIALADLKRAGGKPDDALALYREQLQADPNHKSARAGVVVSLLELGKKEEAEAELEKALADKDQARNLSMLVGAAYWYLAHNDAARGLDLAQRAVAIEPRYSWAEIAYARALLAGKRPLEAERALRFVRQYSRFPTLDYEVATVLASMGLYDEAAQELGHTFALKNGEIVTNLAGRLPAQASSFTELLAPERRAAIFQSIAADTEANAHMLKSLLALNAALDVTAPNEDDLITVAQEFIKGNDAMKTYRQIYVADKFVKKGVAVSTVVDLMDQASTGVEAALNVPMAALAVQPAEMGELRARALAQGTIADVADAPRAALSGLLRARIEDLAGLALFNLNKPAEAATRLRRAVASATEGTPLWRSSMWHLGAALEANGKSDQALLYYIKSYISGPPDPARRSVIETVYKKVNGTLDGLEDKIGPGFAAASASPTASPTP
jgi:tetratricopeptide (TPR) repeat protein